MSAALAMALAPTPTPLAPRRAAAHAARACAVATRGVAEEASASCRRPVLLVEGDGAVAQALLDQLASDGYTTELARSAEHARALAGRCEPRLIVIGALEAPRGALDLLEEIRHSAPSAPLWAPRTPVIVLTGDARSELDMLRAFEAGADDFIAHSGRYLELRVRMRALLRRVERAQAPTERLRVGPLEIDPARHTVDVYGLPLALRRLEFELLAHFATDPERVFTKQELLRAVWGYRSNGTTRTVDSHASRLRRKLEAHGGRWVVNVWGIGYRLR